MIINYFFGTILNAAFGLATQVNHAVGAFTSTLRQSAVPQIMKSQGTDQERSLGLVYSISRYSYLLMLMLAIPILLCIDEILRLWLETPPVYTRVFVIFMLINGMVSNLGAGFDASIQATGKIRKNQIGYVIINLSLLPIVFILYKFGFPPYVNVICMVFLTFVTLIFQIHIMAELTQFSIKQYLNQTIKPAILSTFVAVSPLITIKLFVPVSLSSSIFLFLFSFVWTVTSVTFLGLNPNERLLVSSFIKNKLKLV